MKKTILILSTMAICTLAGCNNSNKKDSDSSKSDKVVKEPVKAVETMVEVDLTDKGIPVTLNAPAGHEVAKGMGAYEMEGVKTLNYEIKKGNFILSASMTEEDMYEEASNYYSQAMELAKSSEGFLSIIKEEPNGFIYKMKNAGEDDYNFYYLLVKNKRAIEFEAGLNMLSNFSQDHVEKMYTVAKGAK